jgi:hypothetical protein
MDRDVAFARQALIARRHEGAWWELGYWHPRCDPRIPLSARVIRRRRSQPGHPRVDYGRPRRDAGTVRNVVQTTYPAETKKPQEKLCRSMQFAAVRGCSARTCAPGLLQGDSVKTNHRALPLRPDHFSIPRSRQYQRPKGRASRLSLRRLDSVFAWPYMKVVRYRPVPPPAMRRPPGWAEPVRVDHSGDRNPANARAHRRVTYGFNIRIEQVLPIETFADIIGVAGPGGPKPVELPGPATIRFVLCRSLPIRPQPRLSGLCSNGYVLLGVCLLLVGLVTAGNPRC